MSEDRIQKIKDKMKVYEDDKMTDSPKYAALKTELKSLTRGSSTPAGVFVIPGASEEDYDAAGGSKFAAAGLHLAEFGMPFEKTPGMSLAFPFTIIAGSDNGKTGEIFTGLSKASLWKLKEILNALGVEITKTKGGNIGFDFAEVAGKQAQVLWRIQQDTRPFDQGGTGGSYTKPVSVLPIGAEAPETLV